VSCSKSHNFGTIFLPWPVPGVSIPYHFLPIYHSNEVLHRPMDQIIGINHSVKVAPPQAPPIYTKNGRKRPKRHHAVPIVISGIKIKEPHPDQQATPRKRITHLEAKIARNSTLILASCQNRTVVGAQVPGWGWYNWVRGPSTCPRRCADRWRGPNRPWGGVGAPRGDLRPPQSINSTLRTVAPRSRGPIP
jgi:hypothetical protein